jgi:hypothetical protein
MDRKRNEQYHYEIYDLVKEDRISRGATLNKKILNVFAERQRIVKVNPHCGNAQKPKIIPRDDMASIDTSGAAPIYDECVLL